MDNFNNCKVKRKKKKKQNKLYIRIQTSSDRCASPFDFTCIVNETSEIFSLRKTFSSLELCLILGKCWENAKEINREEK